MTGPALTGAQSLARLTDMAFEAGTETMRTEAVKALLAAGMHQAAALVFELPRFPRNTTPQTPEAGITKGTVQ